MKQKIKENLFEIMMIVLFLGMAVLVCPHNSINFDEFYTVYWCKCEWSEFLYQVLHDTSPFLYYFMIRPDGTEHFYSETVFAFVAPCYAAGWCGLCEEDLWTKGWLLFYGDFIFKSVHASEVY